MNKEAEISQKDGLRIIGKNISPALFSMISSLAAINPAWTILFLTGIGIVNAWGQFGQTRMNELVQDISKNRNSFDKETLESDEFKSVFLNIIERHMKEVSAQKRKLLRNYLITTGGGENKGFDYHTKLLTILDQITGDELRLFVQLPFVIEDYYKDLRVNFNKRKVFITTHNARRLLKGWNIKLDKLETLFNFLNNYGLISITNTVEIEEIDTEGNSGEAGFITIFTGITEVGETFLKFIEEPFDMTDF